MYFPQDLGRARLSADRREERLVRSGARFATKAMVLSAASNDAAIKIAVRRIRPTLVLERLWKETGCRAGGRPSHCRRPCATPRRPDPSKM